MKMAVIWPRSEVLHFGILHYDSGHEPQYSWNHLKKFVSRCKSTGSHPWLKYSTWQSLAIGKMRLSEDQAWLLFETFDLVSNVSIKDRTANAEMMSKCRSEEDRIALRKRFMVDLMQFVVFLGLQLCRHTPLKGTEDKWPSPKDGRKLKREEANQISLLKNELPRLLELLVEPGSSGEDISLEALQALDCILLGWDSGMLIRTVSQLASSHTEGKMTGYSKLTRTFKMDKVLNWTSQCLSSSPFGSSALLSGERDRKCLVYRSIGRGKVMFNASIALESSYRTLLLYRITSQTIAKGPGLVNGCAVDIQHCHNAYIYILAPLRYVNIEKCSNCQIVLGPVERVVAVNGCDNVTLSTICRRLQISSSHSSTVYTHCMTRPLLYSSCSQVAMAPYNTHYAQLGTHATEAGLLVGTPVDANRWDTPFVINSAGGTDWRKLAPQEFRCLRVPFEIGSGDGTQKLPYTLPEEYRKEMDMREQCLTEWSRAIQQESLTKEQRATLNRIVQTKFMEWLESSGVKKELAGLQSSS